MGIDQSALAAELVNLLAQYDEAVAAGQERKADRLLDQIELRVPNADFNDLMFYGEMERTKEEVIEEAVKREAIYHEQGVMELLQYMRMLMKEAMDRSASDSLDYRNACSKFEEINARLSNIH